MTPHDLNYVKRLLVAKKVRSPVLELGAGYGGSTCRELITQAGMAYAATDMTSTPGVDYVANFEAPAIDASFRGSPKFQTILVLNVLEHSFEPLRILDNARTLLGKGGSLVVITPTIWALHDYPIDCYRLLPNWYERYALSRKMTLDRETFEYVGHGPVGAYVNGTGAYEFPRPGATGVHYWWSRVVHRIFNTYGRGMATPSHLAIGAVLALDEAP
jgi:SAM-dependent methyltransferase